MSGHRNRFSRAEIEEIKLLLYELRLVDRNPQKSIRDRLRRRYGFYITDYDPTRKGFTVADLDDVIRRGLIRVH